MEHLLTIVGPTAVGKTALTVQLATYLHTAVISGDAYQVYRGLSIGTAKPKVEERAGIPHYLIDICNPDDSYNVADFQEAASHYIKKINADGHIPILSGGTGLYVQALLEGYQFSNRPPNQKLRHFLDGLVAEKRLTGLQAYAQELAAKKGINLPFTDKHRLYRTIELIDAGDTASLLSPRKQGLIYDGPVIGLKRERSALYDRINRRVDMMVEQGLFTEVAGLLEAGLSPDAQSLTGIGYREIVAYHKGLLSKEEAIEAIKKHTRHFAKRQITWYKRMPYITWLSIDEDMTDIDIFEQAKKLVKGRFDDFIR